MSPCEHHYCTDSLVTYGGGNPFVVERLGGRATADGWYGRVLCCKCHGVLLIPRGDPLPAVPNKECEDRWREYDRLVDEHVTKYGPLGG